MQKTTNELLFERMMKLPHALRREMLEGRPGPGPRPFGPGPEEPRGFGCGPEGRRGFGPGPGGSREFEHAPAGPRGFGRGPCGGEGGPGPRRPFSRERVLRILADSRDGLRQKALAAELGVNPSSMSEFIDRLEGDGYVARRVDPEDRRATVIALTEMGAARAAEIADEMENRLNRLFGNLTEAEKLELIRLIDKMLPTGDPGKPVPV